MAKKQKKKREVEADPSAPFWMTTFSDMATLLLTFFIMIVSMSTVEVKKFKEALSYFQGRTSFLKEDAVLPPAKKQVMAVQSSGGEALDLERAKAFEEVLTYLEEQGLEAQVQINMTEAGLQVTMIDSLMFESGSAVLLPHSRPVLAKLSDALRNSVRAVAVEGHTDDQPIATLAYPTNWELSSARAMSVVRFLLEQPSALSPADYVGIGHGEFQPVATNATAAGRARNRRVEILFSWESWQNSNSQSGLRGPPEEKSPPQKAARPS